MEKTKPNIDKMIDFIEKHIWLFCGQCGHTCNIKCIEFFKLDKHLNDLKSLGELKGI